MAKKTGIKDLSGRSVSASKASGIKGGAKAKTTTKTVSLAKKKATAKTAAARARP